MEYVNASDLDKFVDDLAKNETSQDYGWNSTNSGLIQKMTNNLGNESLNIPRRNVLDAEKLDKLFEVNRDREAMKDTDAKHFLINSVLNQLQYQTNKLTNLQIDRLVRRFCNNDFDDVNLHRMEIYHFLMGYLECTPPISSHFRWQLICIVISQDRDCHRDDELIAAVDCFAKQVIRFFKESYKSYEYKLFILTLLEYDYAAVIARLKKLPREGVLSEKKRNNSLHSMGELDRFPLAYLLLCKIIFERRNFVELELSMLTRVIVEEILFSFHPKEQPTHLARLYARLVALLLDVLLFVERGHSPHVTDLDAIPSKFETLIGKVRYQCDDEEWQMFVGMADTPWIGELAKRSTRKSFNIGSKGSRTSAGNKTKMDDFLVVSRESEDLRK